MHDNTTMAVISLNEDAVYIVKNGKKTKITPKNHGEDRIIGKTARYWM